MYKNIFLCFSVFLLISCGGGGSGSGGDGPDTNTSSSINIDGIANKGIVINADVHAYVDGILVGTTVTDARGRYRISLPDEFNGSIVEIRVSARPGDSQANTTEMVCDVPGGGGCVDPLSGNVNFGERFALERGFEMRSFVQAMSNSTSFASVTPLTHLAVQRAFMLGGLTQANLDQAVSEIRDTLKMGGDLDILSEVPDIADDASRIAAASESFDYALTNATFLRLSGAENVSYITLIEGLSQDFAEDGVLDFSGMTGNGGLEYFFAHKNGLAQDFLMLPINREFVFSYSYEEQNTAKALNSENSILHGQIYGAVREAGIVGQALTFSGESGYALVPVTFTPGIRFSDNRFSADTWLKLANAADLNGTIMGDIFGGVCSFHWYIVNGYVKWDVCGVGSIMTSVKRLDAQQWYHLAVIYDGLYARLFINGEEDSMREVLFNMPNVYNVLRLASDLNGTIDETRLATISMDAQVIRDYYQLTSAGLTVDPVVVDPIIDTLGKVIHYTFDESISATVPNTAGTGFHDGEVTLGHRIPGKTGQGMALDSSSGKITIPVFYPQDIRMPLDEFTVSAWFKFDASIAAGHHTLLGNGTSGIKSIDIEYIDGRLHIVIFGRNSDRYRAEFPLVFQPDTWQHLVIAYDSRAIKVYLDGIEAGNQTITSVMRDVVNYLYIGNDGGGGFTGAVDDFQFHDRALDASTVLEMFQQP